MTHDGTRDPLSFLSDPVPQGFVVRVVTLAPGCERLYNEADWRDTLVVVKSAEVELEHLDGGRHRFGRGDVLTLDRLPLRALWNMGSEVVVLVAISRGARHA